MSVLATYATGLTLVVVIVVAWITVQGAWRRVFPERLFDADAMIGRLGCSAGCAISAPCPHREADGTCRRKEES